MFDRLVSRSAVGTARAPRSCSGCRSSRSRDRPRASLLLVLLVLVLGLSRPRAVAPAGAAAADDVLEGLEVAVEASARRAATEVEVDEGGARSR